MVENLPYVLSSIKVSIHDIFPIKDIYTTYNFYWDFYFRFTLNFLRGRWEGIHVFGTYM